MRKKKAKAPAGSKKKVVSKKTSAKQIAEIKGKIEALMKKGIKHHKAGELQPAEMSYRRVLSLQPANVHAMSNLAVILKAKGELRAAEEILYLALNFQPDNPDTLFNLGNTVREHGRHQHAVGIYRRLLKNTPEHYATLLNLGDSLRILGNYKAAEDAFAKAAKIKPDHVDTMINQANLFLEMGDGGRAVTMYKKILEKDPDNVRVYANCGAALKQVGELEEAAEFFRKAIEMNPKVTGGAIYSVVGLAKTKPDDPWFELLEETRRKEKCPLPEKISISFALGKMYADIKDYDRAFTNYREGNELRKKNSALLNRRFDEKRHKQTTIDIMDSYSPERLKQIRKPGALGDAEQRPIFIVGMPRSGTTLTEQILSSHSQVCGAGELTYIGEIARAIDAGASGGDPLNFPQNIELLDEESAVKMANRYLTELEKHCDQGLRTVDKMPGNFMYLGLIAHLFPKAKIIECRRHPIDNCLSCYMQSFSRRHEYSDDLKDLATVYNDYDKLMEYWHKELPLPILRMQYEETVNNHEESVRKLLDFCELPWEPEVLEFHKTKRNIQTASVVQVRQPLYKSAIDRWRRYEKHLTPLIEGLDKHLLPENK